MATEVNLGQYRGLGEVRPSDRMKGHVGANIYGQPLALPVTSTVSAEGNQALLAGCRLLGLTLPSDTNALYVATGPAGEDPLTVGVGTLILPGQNTPFFVGSTNGKRHTHLYWINAA
jgi:hypothetical protein